MTTQPIKDGELASADAVMNNLAGQQFKNYAQLLYNSARTGFNSKLNVATGVPNLKNIKYDAMLSDTASVLFGPIEYYSTDKLYRTIPNTYAGSGYYIDIYTTTSTIPTISINNCAIYNLGRSNSAYVYRVYCTTGSDAYKKANVIKTLFYGTNGTDPAISSFAGVSALKSSDANDNGKRVILAKMSCSFHVHGTWAGNYTGTFADTTTNTNCQVWSYNQNSVGPYDTQVTSVQLPSGTNVNYITLTAGGSNTSTTQDETGTDTTAEIQNNPATIKLDWTDTQQNGSTAIDLRAIILCKGTISWVETDPNNYLTVSNVDYGSTVCTITTQTDNFLTASPYLIFQTTSLPTITDCLATWNASIDSDNTLTVSISADGTNYEEVTDATIHRFTNTGTNLYVKFEIDRVDTAAVDKISEYAVWYNTGAA